VLLATSTSAPRDDLQWLEHVDAWMSTATPVCPTNPTA
jgi:hypothetical protein